MTDPVASDVRVRMIEEGDATGHTAALYHRVREATSFPFVPDMFRLTSTRPAMMEAVVAGYQGTFLTDGALPRDTKELIAAWTSQVNQCPYCVGTHNFFLQSFGGSAELVEAVATSSSPDELPVDEPTKALMRLVTQVSSAAYRITDEQWNATSDAGWSDEALLEAVFTAALFNFITRLVDALGLGTSVTRSRISRQATEPDPAA